MTMKLGLAEFLAGAVGTGHTRYRVASPRGYELARGSIAPGLAEAIEALCREDAVALARPKQHEYVVTVESEDGVKSSRFACRIAGGQEDDAEHRVDALQATTPAAVIGHLTRGLIELVKQNTVLATKMLERDTEYVRELEKTRRRGLRAGEQEVAIRVLDIEAEDRRASRTRNEKLLGEVVGLATPFLARLMPAGGPDVAWAKLKESFTESQLTMLAQAIGTIRLARLLALTSAVKAAGVMVDEIPPAVVQAFSAALSQEQQALVGAAFQAEMERRAKERAAADKTAQNGAATGGVEGGAS